VFCAPQTLQLPPLQLTGPLQVPCAARTVCAIHATSFATAFDSLLARVLAAADFTRIRTRGRAEKPAAYKRPVPCALDATIQLVGTPYAPHAFVFPDTLREVRLLARITRSAGWFTAWHPGSGAAVVLVVML
jgi:hypothetical protein